MSELSTSAGVVVCRGQPLHRKVTKAGRSAVCCIRAGCYNVLQCSQLVHKLELGLTYNPQNMYTSTILIVSAFGTFYSHPFTSIRTLFDSSGGASEAQERRTGSASEVAAEAHWKRSGGAAERAAEALPPRTCRRCSRGAASGGAASRGGASRGAARRTNSFSSSAPDVQYLTLYG